MRLDETVIFAAYTRTMNCRNRSRSRTAKHALVVLFATAVVFAPTLASSQEAPGVKPSPREAFVAAAREALVDTPLLFRDALLFSTATDLEQWHYLRTRHGEERVIVDRHDPTLPGEAHWQLVSIDGREPTEDERREYEKDRADHSDADERANNEDWVKVIAPDSVHLLETEGDARRFGYRMQSPDGRREKLFAGLAGDLLVVDDADPAWIREVRLWNTEILRPALGVRIDAVKLVFRFTRQDDWVVPTELQAQWEGEFLMLKDIGDELRFTLADFRHQDTPAIPVMEALPSP
jgi:hypothetical protein